MIIDVHYHVGTKAPGRFDFAIDRKWVKDEMNMFNIEKTIVFPYMSTGSYDALNHEILDTFADEDIIPFARLRLNFKSYDTLKYLSKIKIPGIAKRGLRITKEISGKKGMPAYCSEHEEKIRFSKTMERSMGIKFHDNQDGHLTEENFRFLLSFCKPIVFHINPYKLEYFLSLFADYIKAPIIIAHLGALDADSLYLPKTRELLKRYDFLYTDTAAHIFSNHVIPFLREVPEKILFGSDGPVVSQGSTRCLLVQSGRELFKNGDKALEIIEQNSIEFCRNSGWDIQAWQPFKPVE